MCVLDHHKHRGPHRRKEDPIYQRAQGQILAFPGGEIIRHVLGSDLAVEREPVGHDHVVG